MKKLFILAVLFVAPFAMIAQKETAKDTVPNGWTRAGNISLLFNQAAFNHEWTGGGTSNYSGNLSLTYDFNYKHDKISWNNRLIGEYGITKNKDDKYSRKTNDRLELNSILGKQIKESNWYYSLFFNFKTQFAKGYEFNKDLEPEDIGYRTEKSHILSPAYIQFGPGLLWKKSNNLYVNISPATAKLIIVDKDFTAVNEAIPGAVEAYNENKYYGVGANETSRFEFGASLSGYAKLDLMENISMENILNLYSNYLEDPQNVDIDYTMNLLFKVNKYISANATFQAIYDDNAAQGFQIREALGIGATYGF
ncbi:Protein of unknown function (DUF3078) [Aequorivita sublithincola DSM 14238]|uniref:DUF3078 domain-containing protein n=1 Tax=Aequorivita sublithincola (strain DSM 14238 / LMG 21431 / ACAM 643 / 9-3) TaxID=746697 RepID=I3YVH8_AEQSU|nr:DUF3078 domain-containing protein [Aequorivita sublithincola]AFL80996.1 Protein of unknown function (DUF3078) [Aequorivita sublithincola DSM 14238]